jgi:hypothetical protein
MQIKEELEYHLGCEKSLALFPQLIIWFFWMSVIRTFEPRSFDLKHRSLGSSSDWHVMRNLVDYYTEHERKTGVLILMKKYYRKKIFMKKKSSSSSRRHLLHWEGAFLAGISRRQLPICTHFLPLLLSPSDLHRRPVENLGLARGAAIQNPDRRAHLDQEK